MASSSSGGAAPPRRFIYSDDDLHKFLQSPAKRELMQVTAAMGKACASIEDESGNHDCEDPYEFDPAEPLVDTCPSVAALVGSLREMEKWIHVDFPPEPNNMVRFGNPAFRSWHAQLVQRGPSIVKCILQHHWHHHQPTKDPFATYSLDELKKAASDGEHAASAAAAAAAQEEEESSASTSDPHGATDTTEQGDDDNDDDDDASTDDGVVTELCAYLEAAFGHPIRLDYGTGHECSFQVFLLALIKLGCFGSTIDQPPTISRLRASTLALYSTYLSLCRTLQIVYRLEPAGSHGVWGLDDFQCLPFYLGACQLQTQDEITPKSIHDDSILNREGSKYLYLGCIRYIKSVKKGVPFFESQPMLNDISQLSSWHKVSTGLLKLFEGEVLNKRQVVQHLVFGKIFAANWTTSEDPSPAVPKLPPDSLLVGVDVRTTTSRPSTAPHPHGEQFQEDQVL